MLSSLVWVYLEFILPLTSSKQIKIINYRQIQLILKCFKIYRPRNYPVSFPNVSIKMRSNILSFF